MLADNQYAKEDVWFLGDQFLKNMFQAFTSIDIEAIKNEKPRPFTFDNYNVKYYWKSFTSSGNPSPAGCTVNSLIDGINGNPHLPKYIIVITDTDLLKRMTYFKFGASLVIGKALGSWLGKLMDAVNDRFKVLKKIRSGAVVEGEPKFIFMGIIERPHPDKVLSLRRKYNEILEETLTLYDECYFFNPKNALSRYDFDRNNHITSAGKVQYWKLIDDLMRRFEIDNTEFRPTKIVTEMNKQAAENCRYIMPKPPSSSSTLFEKTIDREKRQFQDWKKNN